MSQAAAMPGPEILPKMRKVLGLRQFQLSERTGINQARISQWETGLLDLRAEELEKITDVLAREVYERSEAQSLPQATDVSQTSAECGKQFRDQRLSWQIPQTEMVDATGIAIDTLSMFERGFVEIAPEEFTGLTKALTDAIARRTSQIQWFMNPAELEKRREALGVSRKRMAWAALRKPAEWLAAVECGKVPLDEQTSARLWQYLARLESQHGEVTELSRALSAPVIPPPPVPLPMSNHRRARYHTMKKHNARLLEIHLLEKSLKLKEEQYKSQQEISSIRTWQVNALEVKIGEMEKIAARLAPSAERDELIKVLSECQEEIINQ